METKTIDAMEPRFDLRPGTDGTKSLLLGQILLRDLSHNDLSGISAAVGGVLSPEADARFYRSLNVDFSAFCCRYKSEARELAVYLIECNGYQQEFTIGEMNDLAALLKNELLNHSGEFGVTCEGVGDGRYCAIILHGAAVVLDGLSQDDLGNFIDAMRRIRKATSVDGKSLNVGAGQVVIIRSEDDGYTDAVYSIVANGRMVELTPEQFNAVIQELEQAHKAAVPAPFPTPKSDIYFAKEFGAKTADSYDGTMACVVLYAKGMRIDVSTAEQAQLLHRLLCQLESGEAAVVVFAEHFICYNAGVFWLHNFDNAPVLLTPAELVDIRMGLGTALDYAESVPSWYPSGRFPAPQEAHEPVAIAVTKSGDKFVLNIGRLQLWLDGEDLSALYNAANSFFLSPNGNTPPLATWFKTKNEKIALTSGEAGTEPCYMILRESGAFQGLSSTEFLNLYSAVDWAVRKHFVQDVPSVLTVADSTAVPNATAKLPRVITMADLPDNLPDPYRRVDAGELSFFSDKEDAEWGMDLFQEALAKKQRVTKRHKVGNNVDVFVAQQMDGWAFNIKTSFGMSGWLSEPEFAAVIEQLRVIAEEPAAAANPAPFARLSESLLTMGHGLVHLDPPLYKLELGEFAAEPLDYHSLAVLYQNAKRVLDSPVPASKTFNTSADWASVTSFHRDRDGSKLHYAVVFDDGKKVLTAAQMEELVGVLGELVLAWEPNAADKPRARISPSETNIGQRGIVYKPPLYKLEVGELTAEPLDNISLANFYRAAKFVLESPIPTQKMFETSLGNVMVSSFDHDENSTVLKYAVTCDGDWEQIDAVQLGELVEVLGDHGTGWMVAEFVPHMSSDNLSHLLPEQGEPAADGITMLKLGTSYFDPSSLLWFNDQPLTDQPLTVTLDPLALTINNIVAQLARLSAVAGIAWENQPQPFVAGGE